MGLIWPWDIEVTDKKNENYILKKIKIPVMKSG